MGHPVQAQTALISRGPIGSTNLPIVHSELEMAGYRPRSIFSRHCHTRKQSPADQLLNKKQCLAKNVTTQIKHYFTHTL